MSFSLHGDRSERSALHSRRTPWPRPEPMITRQRIWFTMGPEFLSQADDTVAPAFNRLHILATVFPSDFWTLVHVSYGDLSDELLNIAERLGVHFAYKTMLSRPGEVLALLKASDLVYAPRACAKLGFRPPVNIVDPDKFIQSLDSASKQDGVLLDLEKIRRL